MREAQTGLCTICGGRLAPERSGHTKLTASRDHTYPKARYGMGNQGNMTLTHAGCNAEKSDRDPTGCEVIWLHAVNARMGWQLQGAKRLTLSEMTFP
jgi:5-methylcytosine-specific restriction endonuclease McrA